MYKVSVLIPVYNVENYIEKCARSLFTNTIASDCEFIFTNDCTPDTSMEILNLVIKDFPHLKDNIKIFNHERNMGLAVTRNTGFEHSTGEYIICTDSDDYVEPTYLEDLYNEAKKGDFDIVGCDNFVLPDYTIFDNKYLEKKIKKHPLPKDPKSFIEDIFTEKISSYLWIKLIKKEFLVNNNIKWDNDVILLEDMLIVTKILSKNPSISYISKPLYNYIYRNNSIIHGGYNLKKLNNLILMLNRLKELLQNIKMHWAFDFYNILVCRLKRDCLLLGTNKVQQVVLSYNKEVNKCVDKISIKPFYKAIIKISNFSSDLAYFILHTFFLAKCIFKRIDYKKYNEH